ncbi:hypothetical protein TGAM01_v210580 [Trichoderma gamsii]|uniref:DNA ligase D 3'-phosphoesterase domain-containing protein n=1 Tax=Trichoderma gamsii TaxID=398673 RepID=A0A2P4Z8D1_9HYPO|nr:hypothetical protein TGAM01_v210580 [Trichoderma gamsii]PON20545.1 hypothetical protein TGAM01_v210580 [Trichoderma gamsii]
MAPSHKRPLSPPVLIPNPFIKKRNLAWSLESPSSSQDPHPATSSSLLPTPSTSAATATASTSAALADSTAAVPTDISTSTAISPPAAPARPRPTAGTTAEIEAGAVQISDHLAQFTSTLSSRLRPTSALVPRLSISGYSSLYQRCAGSPSGAHFVIHQHDHPVAGTHYDLRLQINEASSVSWAIMYGLPGDANSSRLNRNATETRIHSLWAKTASAETGSLIIWDTGTYSVLPRRSKHAPPEDPSSPPGSPHSSSSSSNSKQHTPTAQSLLHAAFKNRKIRLRLHGTKLPDPYVINIRLTKTEDAAGRSRSSKTPRTRRRGKTAKARPAEPESTSSDSDGYGNDIEDDEPQARTGSTNNTSSPSEARRKQQQQEDAQVRLNNAYVGASNTIGSVYQRRWYLSLDRRACGFTERKRHGRSVWERLLLPDSSTDTAAKDPSDDSGEDPEESSCRLSFPFYVRGPQFEQSVVTGRLAEEVLRDEGVTTFVPRKGWTPVMK